MQTPDNLQPDPSPVDADPFTVLSGWTPPPNPYAIELGHVAYGVAVSTWRPCADCLTPITCEEQQDRDRCP